MGRSTLGSEETIKTITRQDLVDFYKDKLTSGRMVLVVSGGVGLEHVRQKAEEQLLVPKSDKVTLGNDLPVIRQSSVSVEPYVGKDQVHLALGFRSVKAFNGDSPALDVIAQVLGGGRASTLTRKLRYEKGLVYGVSAWQHEFGDTGAWVVKTSTSKDKVQEVVDVITDEAKRVAESGLTPEEVEFAQDKIIKSKRMQMQSSEAWVDFHAYRELLAARVWTLTNYVQEIAAVSPRATQDVAKKYFGQNKWYLAMCGDISESSIQVNF